MSNSFPALPPRSNHWERFSSYLVLEQQNTRVAWKPQFDLRRNLQLYQANHSDFATLLAQEDNGLTIAEFWRKIAIGESEPPQPWERENRQHFALRHLAAYWEKQCYWSATDVFRKHPYQSLEDYFYVAKVFIYDFCKLLEILKKYNSEFGANLNTYLQGVLSKQIQSELKIGKCSNWRLLCNQKDEDLIQALQGNGYTEAEISKFLFARKYFKRVYLINKVKNPNRPPGTRWPIPDQTDFAQTAQLYNAEKLLRSAPLAVFNNRNPVQGETIKLWMEQCLEAVKKYSQSFLAEMIHQSSDDQTQNLPEIEADFLNPVEPISFLQQIGTVFLEENERNLSRIHQKIQGKKDNIKYTIIPILSYGLNLTETQIAAFFGVNQSKINRYLNKEHELPLLNKLGEFSQPKEWVKSLLARWFIKGSTLRLHSDLLESALVEALKNLQPEFREVLEMRYSQNLCETEIANHFCINEEEVNQRISKAQASLEKSLLIALEKWSKKYVRLWLIDFYKNQVYSVMEGILKQIDPVLKQIILDVYGQRQNEKQIAANLGLPVNQVAEKIDLAKINLQEKLVDWIQENLEISLKTPAELLKINRILDEWLEQLYQLSGAREEC